MGAGSRHRACPGSGTAVPPPCSPTASVAACPVSVRPRLLVGRVGALLLPRQLILSPPPTGAPPRPLTARPLAGPV
eukprot:5645716-Prymnesium_polylepis.1